MRSFIPSRLPRAGRRRAAALGLAALMTGVTLPAATARADTGPRVDLRVLLVTDGGPSTAAIAAQMDREGVPYTTVSLTDAARPQITAAYLEDAAAHEGRFQAVVLPNQAGTGTFGLSAAEQTALATYERSYGVRQVDAYVYPGATLGMATPTFAGSLDGSTATVSAAGLAGPFSYLKGSLAIDNIDPSVIEVYGYLAAGATGLPAGQTYTPLLSVTAGGATGSVVGVYAHDYREELVITAAFNQYQRWGAEIGHGIVTWMTRGVHLGYHRNYFAVQVDDIFMPNSRWSATGHCTPGDDCVDPTITTTDIRMTPADVTKLVAWQAANGWAFDMIFNGAGSDEAVADNGSDPLTTAFTTAGTESQFTWINHTYNHPFLGCIQIPPAVVGQLWRCATAADLTLNLNPALDPSNATLVGDTVWLNQSRIEEQIQLNQAWAAAHHLTHFDPSVLVTGEHSGLATLPQQPVDNPFFAPALTTSGITVTSSDASREAGSRTVGTTVTMPRHPMNIFYNVATYTDEVSEYNWIYTSVADGGGGICTANPATSTCITPLPVATPAQAKASFDSYIKPLEISHAYTDVVTGDPRPLYAHQSNLTEDGILYPVVTGVLDQYKATFDTTKSPIVHADFKAEAQALTRTAAWKPAQPSITAYIDAAGVHVSGPAGTQLPLTMPTGTTVNGITLDAYDGELSGWLAATATDTVVAGPPTLMGGYVGVGVPPAPVASAAPADASAVLSWTISGNGGSALTGYVVHVYAGTGTTPLQTLSAAGTATGMTVTGLTNGSPYTFDVAATNAFGTGPASARTGVVTPGLVPGAPTIGTVTGGNASATVAWTAPAANGTPVTGYTVKAYVGSGTTPVQTLTAAATATSLVVSGLANGTAYTFDVAATNAVGTGPASARSAAVTPAAPPAIGAPTITSAIRGNAQVSLAWAPPAVTGGAAITGYVVRTYVGTGLTPLKTNTTAGTATSLVVTGLTNGTGYTFDVAAMTAGGTGPASARTAVITPATTPGQPGIGAPTRGNGSATVTWTAPTTNGGATITGYTVRAYVGTGSTAVQTLSAAATATSLTVTGLTNGTAYTFTVAAVNAVGSGPLSARSAAVTPATVPGAPVIGTASAGTAGGTVTATARWNPPTSTGGSAITGYRVNALRMSSTGAVLSTSISGLQPATSRSVTMTLRAGNYRFTVQAVNAAGTGAASARSNLVAAR